MDLKTAFIENNSIRIGLTAKDWLEAVIYYLLIR